MLHGVAWTGALKWATQVLSWASTLVVARILSPSDYGLFGLATLYAGLVQLINEFGLGAAVVRRRDLTEPQIAAVGGVSLALGASLWGLSALAAPLVAAFFHAPDLRYVIVAMGVTFVTTGIRVIPKSLLARDLQFRRVASIDAVEAMTATATVLTFAMLGFRYWALVIGTIAGSVASTLVALVWRRHRITWPRAWDEVAGAVEFGSHIVISRISWYLYSNADFGVVGKRLGTATLGASTAILKRTNGGANTMGDWIAELANQYIGRFKLKLLRMGFELWSMTPVTVSGRLLATAVSQPDFAPIAFRDTKGGSVAVWIEMDIDGPLKITPPASDGEIPREGDVILF